MTDFQQIKGLGSEVLKKINSKNEKVIKWKIWLDEYRFAPNNLDEPYAWLTVVLALKSVESGNYGVGSILVDVEGNVISMGHNLVYSPYFRSDLHGEMVALNLFEKENPEIVTLEGYTLYTSLESCPMCLVRLICSGINSVLHVSPDPLAGMVSNISFLPPLWKELSERQTFAKAACSEELTKAAMEIMLINAEELLEILRKRSAPLSLLKEEVNKPKKTNKELKRKKML
jgi:cytosine deaminase